MYSHHLINPSIKCYFVIYHFPVPEAPATSPVPSPIAATSPVSSVAPTSPQTSMLQAIVIPASVALIVLVIAVVFTVVCLKRRKRRRSKTGIELPEKDGRGSWEDKVPEG